MPSHHIGRVDRLLSSFKSVFCIIICIYTRRPKQGDQEEQSAPLQKKSQAKSGKGEKNQKVKSRKKQEDPLNNLAPTGKAGYVLDLDSAPASLDKNYLFTDFMVP